MAAAINNMGEQNYIPYKEKQKKLLSIIERAGGMISSLNMDSYKENLKKLSEKIENDSFKIQIVGTFKNGKSTFINSFLGEEILPAYTLPATCVINEVKYGKEKKARVHFCNPITNEMRLQGIPERALKHIMKYNKKDIPPLEIPYNEIKSYVTIPLGEDPKIALMTSPYEKVELFWPMELLKNGVEIIDSPGLNEAEARTKVTMEYLTKADAIIFLLIADKLLSQDELDFIQHNLSENGFDKPFFIVNKCDVVRKRELPGVISYTKERLMNYTAFSDSGFYFVSALNALDGKIDNDEELYRSSGMPEFEKRLSEFLTKEKGLAKLSQPAREIKRILSLNAMESINTELSALEHSLDHVKKRYDAAKPKLKELQHQKEMLRERLNNKIMMALPEIRRCAVQHIADMCRSIPAWTSEYQPNTKLGFMPTKSKQERLLTEISDYLRGKLESDQNDWKNNVLTPLITDKVQEIFGSIESDLEKIFNEIDNTKVDITGAALPGSSVPTWQRVAGAVGGLLIGDVGLAFSAGLNGFGKDLAKTLAIEFGGGMLLGLLGLTNPIFFIALLVGTAIFNFKSNESKAVTNIKKAVVDGTIKQLNENKDAITDELTDKVTKKFNELADTVVLAVDKEINGVDEQVKGILSELEKGQSSVEQRKKDLTVCRNQINAAVFEVDDFVDDLMKSVF